MSKNDVQKALDEMSIVRKTTGHGESDSFIGFKDWYGEKHIKTIRTVLEQALQPQKAVDVEGLKKKGEMGIAKTADGHYCDGWNACLDYLKQKGTIK